MKREREGEGGEGGREKGRSKSNLLESVILIMSTADGTPQQPEVGADSQCKGI